MYKDLQNKEKKKIAILQWLDFNPWFIGAENDWKPVALPYRE